MNNCKVGDLASLKTGNIPGGDAFAGRFVDVVGDGGSDGFFGKLWAVKGVGWTPTPDMVALTRRGTFVYPDKLMQPIRDQPGADETLTWAGKPAELPADVIREVTACS